VLKDEPYYEECIMRVLEPATSELKKAAIRRFKDRMRGSPGHHDDPTESHNDDDDDTATVVPNEFLDTHASPMDAGWKAKYRFPLSALQVKGLHNNTGVYIQISLDKSKQVRELVFDTREDAIEFQDLIAQEQAKEQDRAQAKLDTTLVGEPIIEGDAKFLIEIVSGWNLPVGDLYSSDPFVVCMFKNKEIHRTKHISKT
jgi:hypothetical protein